LYAFYNTKNTAFYKTKNTGINNNVLFAKGSPTVPVVVDCSRISHTDFTAAKSFKAMIGDFKARKIRIFWLRPAQQVVQTLQAISGEDFWYVNHIYFEYQ
jgi:anti-anti-sigma regulatory factor